MNFTEFIGQNHPDPDSLLNAKFDQLCKLAEDYAEYKQLPQSRVVGECVIHSTDWHGKCFKCDEQVFTRKDD